MMLTDEQEQSVFAQELLTTKTVGLLTGDQLRALFEEANELRKLVEEYKTLGLSAIRVDILEDILTL